MSVIDMGEEPVIELVDLLPVFLRVKIRCIHRLELSELHLNIIGKSVIVIIYCLLLDHIHKGGCGRTALVLGVRIFVKLGQEMYTCDGILKILLIRKAVESGKTLENAITECTFEPDAPNYTPRISLVIKPDTFEFGINRRRSDGSCERSVWSYPKVVGKLQIIHTYEGDGNPLVSFVGEPRALEAEDDCAQGIWASLDHENRISLYVMEGNKETVFNARESE